MNRVLFTEVVLVGLVLVLAISGCRGDPALPTSTTELEQAAPPPVEPGLPAQVEVTGSATVSALKNGIVEVGGELRVQEGALSLENRDTWSGATGRVELALDSYDSGDLMRDSRVKSIFLRVEEFSTATFVLSEVTGLPAEGLAVGSRERASLVGEVTLAGQSQGVELPVVVTRTAADAWTLESRDPVPLSMDGFGLTETLEKLRTTCQHKSLGERMKVTISVEAAPPPPVPAPADPPGSSTGSSGQRSSSSPGGCHHGSIRSQ